MKTECLYTSIVPPHARTTEDMAVRVWETCNNAAHSRSDLQARTLHKWFVNELEFGLWHWGSDDV